VIRSPQRRRLRVPRRRVAGVSRRRAAIAAVLGLLAPGLGHVYLRAWIRAVAWFLLAAVTVAVMLPESAYEAIDAGGIEAAIEASTSLPTRVYLASLTVRAASALGAGLLGLRGSTAETPEGGQAPNCPHCGGDLDDELDFCPWCTTRLDRRT
jgi:hypothetical protein